MIKVNRIIISMIGMHECLNAIEAEALGWPALVKVIHG
jgi:hypothetical protein